MFCWCNELFSRAHYRYYLKVFSSQLGFESARPICQRELIAFVSNPKRFPANRFEFMFPCAGRHEPIRTNPQTDDYYYKFLLAATPDRKIFYVFVADKMGHAGHVYKLYEEILDMTSPIPNVLIREEDKSREALLMTIPTINSWSRSVEKIYVNEVMASKKPIEDKLQGVQPRELYILCASLLTTASYSDDLFIVDWKRLQQWDKKPEFINLYFDHADASHSGAQQVAYPCYGKHDSGKTTENEKRLNLFKISSGPRENSILVYIHLFYRRDYKIRRIHENVNLKGLVAIPPYHPRTEEAGPSEPASKRIRTEPIVPPGSSYPMPDQSMLVASSPTSASQPVQPIWTQRKPLQRTDAPSPQQMRGLVYSSPSAGQQPATPQLRPAYQTQSRGQQLPIPTAGLPYQTPSRDRQLPLQAAGFPYRTPSQGQQLPIQVPGLPSQVPVQPIQIPEVGLPYQTSTASQQLSPPPTGSSYHDFSLGQPITSQAMEPTHQTETARQQLSPPEVGSSNPVLSQDEQPVQAVEPFILSPDKEFEARVAGHSSAAFPSTDERNQQLSVEDYGLDYMYFTDTLDLQPSADDGGLLDAWKPFRKNNPGQSEDP